MKNIFDIVKNYWWLILIGLWFVYSIFFTADRDSAGNVTKSGWVNVDQLQAGDCILDNDLVDNAGSEDDEYYQYWITPCEQEHSAEVFYKYDLGNKYRDRPVLDDIRVVIEEICNPAFEQFVGLSFEEIISNYSSEIANLNIAAYYPLEEAWSEYKGLDCLVYSMDSELMIGSVKDFLR
tara:strand:- start:181 stop:717 length:537 start_codon:yes stop_codon:yes gene_type:complete